MKEHVIVYHKKGICAGWPANYGMYIWGNEILCGLGVGEYVADTQGHHVREPRVTTLARSLDGGHTWSVEEARSLSEIPTAELPGGLDFTHPNFAWLLMMGPSNQAGPSYCWSSLDRGRSWLGPYLVPNIGLGVITRTDYLVDGPGACTAMFTCCKPGPKGKGVSEGRVGCVRTTDGGRTFHLVGWAGDCPGDYHYDIMPSTVRCSASRLVTTIRCGRSNEDSFLAVRRSDDNGATWREIHRFEQKWNSNPGALIRMKDGRMAMAFADRGKLALFSTVSRDDGGTWSKPAPLRDDCANWDMGYAKSVLRDDGTIVTVYYYSTQERPEMHIAATLWKPEA